MRIDLTHAAVRVLIRAGKPGFIPISSTGTVLTLEKLLLALFQEEECRAAEWLHEAGLTEDQFREDFGIASNVMRLFSTAPPFPTGSYGISPGQPNFEPSAEAAGIQVQNSDPDGPTVIERPERPKQSPPQEPDSAEISSTLPPAGPPPGWLDAMKSARNMQFFVDGESVELSRVSEEFESVMTMAQSRFARLAPPVSHSVVGGNSRVIQVVPERLTAKVVFATEHLLFAAVLDEGQTGTWLRDKGFDPADLFDRINGLYGRRDDLERLADSSEPAGDEDDQPIDFSEPSFASASKPENSFSPSEKTPLSAAMPTVSTNTNTDSSSFSEHYGALRLLDAAANRAREAARVLEDDVRFLRDDPYLTRLLKEFRHEMTEAFRRLPQAERLAMRETESDVGTELTAEGEYRRDNAEAIRAANFARLQESLRSLEEFSKLAPLAAGEELPRLLERLRYRAYTLHKIVTIAAMSSSRLHDRRLYVLIDAGESESSFERLVTGLIDAGVDLLQLRDKKADDRTLLARARILRSLTADGRTLFIMNDRADLAIAAEADGVHVGQEELAVRDLRRLVGPNMLIGVSTHSVDQARRAVLDGAHYIGIGPVFASGTKNFDSRALLGTEPIREIMAELRIPAYAIGGITATNLPELLSAGVTRIAVGAAVTAAEDPSEAARQLRKMLVDSP